MLASELASRKFSYPRSDGSQWTLALKDVIDRVKLVAPSESIVEIGHLDGWGAGLHNGPSIFMPWTRGNPHERYVTLLAEGRALAHPFSMSCVHNAGQERSDPYWRDVGTIDAYWDANIDLTATDPLLNLYDTRWPIWTYQPQLPPAKFVHNADDRRGMAIESLVSGGCIVSGSTIRNSVLFSNVLVRSYSAINEVVILPDVQIGRNCRLTKCVIDRRCHVPDGLVVGEDPELDAQRFFRTENGVVLITKQMLKKL